MSVIAFPTADQYNPLDDMEDLLESSAYDYKRETESRLQFLCESKQSRYTIILEWHFEFNAVRCSVVMEDARTLSDVFIETMLEKANESAWHGFYIRDGVGNISFKSLVKMIDDCPVKSITAMEDCIDRGIEEVDRLYLSLALDKHKQDQDASMFPEEEWKVENLALIFSDPKGNA